MDTFFQQGPPKREDAIFMTDYKTATRRNEYIKYINDIYRDDLYRQFLQKNGGKITEKEWAYLRKNNSCWTNDCVHVYPTRVIPRHMLQERQAVDTIFSPNRNTSKILAVHKCAPFKDYRLN